MVNIHYFQQRIEGKEKEAKSSFDIQLNISFHLWNDFGMTRFIYIYIYIYCIYIDRGELAF